MIWFLCELIVEYNQDIFIHRISDVQELMSPYLRPRGCARAPNFFSGRHPPNAALHEFSGRIKIRKMDLTRVSAFGKPCNACQHFRNVDTCVSVRNRTRKRAFLSGWPILPRPKGFLYIETLEQVKSEKIFWPNCNVQLKHASFIPTTQHAMFEKIFFE